MSSKKNKTNYKEFREDEILEIELLKEQMFSAIIGIVAQIVFYKASSEELKAIYNEHNGIESSNVDIDGIFLDSAKYFLLSQVIFTSVSLRYYEILEYRINEGLEEDYKDPQIYINLSGVINTIGSIYFLYAIILICNNNKNNEPII